MSNITEQQLREDTELNHKIDNLLYTMQSMDATSPEYKTIQQEYNKLVHEYYVINHHIRLYYMTL